VAAPADCQGCESGRGVSTTVCRACDKRFALMPRAGRNTGRKHRGRPATLAPARYCSSACRKAASRARIRRDIAGRQERLKTSLGTYPLSGVTSPLQGFELSREKGASKTVEGIVPDDHWPGMYRVRLPGGGLSDMVNLTRARDAATACEALRRTSWRSK
jgi:hypothetical protein